MSLPSLSTPSRWPICTGGDVVLHEGAAVAAGAILVADPGSSLVVETGACIGMGAVLHATGGELRIEAGATLGAGVLVVGKGKVGRRACVGTCTTLLEPTVAEGSVIPSGEVVGGFGEPQPASEDPAPLAVGPPPQGLQHSSAPTVTGQAHFDRLKSTLMGKNGVA